MASRLILKDAKLPLRFLLRNPASSAPSAQTIQNLLLLPILPRQSASGLLGGVCSSDRPLLSRDLNSSFDGGLRIEVRGKREPEIEEIDEFGEHESESDLEFSDDFSGDEFSDNDDAEPEDDDN
ncbi:unnamed protein product [Citrullus colocynthis]|uniref:Uncharacterized protein n=1 Tax=Citrullus colocynthis TaxID=252529 RepID=A0ABP0Z0H9_9ROSI